MKKYCEDGLQKRRRRKLWAKRIGMLCLMFAVLLWTSPELHTYAAVPTVVLTNADTAPNWAQFEPVMILRWIASLYLSYISVKGAIQLGNNISELSKSIKNNDDASKQSALDGMFGGGLQFFISGLLAILGITI